MDSLREKCGRTLNFPLSIRPSSRQVYYVSRLFLASKLTIFSDERAILLILRHLIVVCSALLVEKLEGSLYESGVISGTAVLTVNDLRGMVRAREAGRYVWCVELGYLYFGLERGREG